MKKILRTLNSSLQFFASQNQRKEHPPVYLYNVQQEDELSSENYWFAVFLLGVTVILIIGIIMLVLEGK